MVNGGITILTSEFISRHKKELGLAKGIRTPEALKEFLTSAQEKHFKFYERLKETIRNPLRKEGAGVRYIVIHNGLPGYREDTKEVTVSAVDKILHSVIEQSEAALYIAEHLEKLMQLKYLIRDRRLKNFMETSGVARPY